MSFRVRQVRDLHLSFSQVPPRRPAWRQLPLTLYTHNWPQGFLTHCRGSSEAHTKTVTWLFGPFQQRLINWGFCHSSDHIEHLKWAVRAHADLTSIVKLDTVKLSFRDEILPRIDTTEARFPAVVDGLCWMTIASFCTRDDTAASVSVLLLASSLKF